MQGDLHRLAHEFSLKSDLDGTWAARPVELIRDHGWTVLLIEEPGGEPLDRLLGHPMKMGLFLRTAVSLATALSRLHERGLIHKDIKPANVLADPESGEAWLTGFGITSRLPRERALPDPPEIMTGTLAYMAPEQTGRMNRSIDPRTDLYALGVTFYEMLTGSLPFTAESPMEWVHCHIARKPVPPGQRLRSIPAVVSAIVMKLLAKVAEERYQTAAGLVADLQRCLADWEHRGQVGEFVPGIRDTPGRLLIPEKLYGRTRDIETLLAAFERVVVSGRPELVVVTGYSGIGKSSFVNELHKVLVPPRGLFASGKFDQYKRDIPYSTLAQASASLIRMLLGKSEEELGEWRDALREALGPNAQLMVNLVPVLELVIGAQPPVPELPPKDAQSRFQLLFRRFIGVFARREHPLALFLDDLQWLDSATLDLFEDLLTSQDVQHLIVIGAYRDNEVDAAHPLMRKLAGVRHAGAVVREIKLAPLAHEDVEHLLADSLRCEPQEVARLAHLVYEKTAGNPFFVIQFISVLAEESLLTFDHARSQWRWDLQRIFAKGFTDNVVDLMVGKLNRLSVAAQRVVQILACFGNSCDVQTLSFVCDISEEEIHAALWEALFLELIARAGNIYKFVHDRVQEAVYSLIPTAERAQVHLRIGRLLRDHTPAAKQEEAIFEIVSQLNRGIELIDAREEAEQLAGFNLIAGKRAKNAAAHAAALNYLATGMALLPDDAWTSRRELVFQLELNRAECEFLTGDLQAAEQYLNVLATRAVSEIERTLVASSRIDLYTALSDSSRAVAVCVDFVRSLGSEWPLHPTEQQCRREYDRIFSQLRGRAIADLIESPLMDDPPSVAMLDVLAKVFPCALYTDAKLLALLACKAVNLTLKRGNTDASCVAYVWLGQIAGPLFGDYKAGAEFGRLGYELVERRGLVRFQARVYLWFAQFIVPWTQHVSVCREHFLRAFEVANRIGDLTVAAYVCTNINTNLLAVGEPLSDAEREAGSGIEFARKSGMSFAIDSMASQLAMIRTLRGLTYKFGTFDDAQFDEASFERRLESRPALGLAACRYWTRKLQARFLAGDYRAAVDALQKARELFWIAPSLFEVAESHYYGALAIAAVCDCSCGQNNVRHLEVLQAMHAQMKIWADNCPENFADSHALVSAELARIDGRDFEAMRHYECAVRAAREHGFVHHEALANELAARFYAARGFDRTARTYLRDAYHGYLRWEATGKVRQLEHLYPYLLEVGHVVPSTSTIATPVQQLDLATVIKVSQAVSGEIVREKLIDILMRTALEHAGAERGVLTLMGSVEQRIEARISDASDPSGVSVRELGADEATLPASIIQYAARTRESVILADTSVQNPFSDDPYIRQNRARSLLCVPLANQANLIGALYLENSLSPDVFTPTRIAMLKLLASQAAISLENTRLYRDLEEREAKIRRLVDANIIGIFIWDAKGAIVEANDAFLHMVDYDRKDVIDGRVSWSDLTPSEWLAQNQKTMADLRSTGVYHAQEKEYLRRDGSRVPVLLGAAAFDERCERGVAFVVDLTERKRTEREMHEIQMNLMRSNRIETLGQLSASIAHEIRQPVSAAVTNAHAALRWMNIKPLDLGEVRAALNGVIKSGDRASDVLNGMHALFRKAPPREDPVEINQAIKDVITLTAGEASKYGVAVQTYLTDNLPPVQGDRVQLQQVMVNLVINAFEAMSQVREGTRELRIHTAASEPDSISVSVEDSGPGLSQDDLEKIFQAFYTTKSGGLGVGLSICRSIIEAHGGQLWATPGAQRGVTFQFVLPCSPQKPSASGAK
ncbi:MAG: AAA family ATPase [Pseudomonadota bacterium]|uniref:trifunctional serine/threonine-protein kinase/ATP-binding protein/sensor histidine kinase n=2 Tax=Burkholderiales TaxID=80840 RepID=UPI00148533BE|nr:ATP-binding sensor histidine kinase [Burkholderia sp. 4M9327F10]